MKDQLAVGYSSEAYSASSNVGKPQIKYYIVLFSFLEEFSPWRMPQVLSLYLTVNYKFKGKVKSATTMVK